MAWIYFAGHGPALPDPRRASVPTNGRHPPV